MSSHQLLYTRRHLSKTPTTPRIIVLSLVLPKSVGLGRAGKLLCQDRYSVEFVAFPTAMAYYEIIKNGQSASDGAHCGH